VTRRHLAKALRLFRGGTSSVVEGLDYWPTDGSEKWLNPVDAIVALALLKTFSGQGESPAAFIEVGVWKGAFSSVLLKNYGDLRGIGIDPYPNNASAKAVMEKRFQELGLFSKFELFGAWEDVPESTTLESQALIHIDGDHSEEAVTRDLCMASKYVRPDGVLVIDDYRHFWFPGIASAMHSFIGESEWQVFALTPAKAYLAVSKFAGKLQTRLAQALRVGGTVPLWNHFREWDESRPYTVSPDMYGNSPLLIGEGPLPLPAP